jgi:hypothetical protein
MITLVAADGVSPIGLPRIGAGLGGLAWNDVRGPRSALGASTPVELVVFEDFVPVAQGAGVG